MHLSLLFIATATMISQRLQRICKPKVIWEAAEVPGNKIAKRTISKGLRTVKKEVLIPILVNLLQFLQNLPFSFSSILSSYTL